VAQTSKDPGGGEDGATVGDRGSVESLVVRASWSQCMSPHLSYGRVDACRRPWCKPNRRLILSPSDELCMISLDRACPSLPVCPDPPSRSPSFSLNASTNGASNSLAPIPTFLLLPPTLINLLQSSMDRTCSLPLDQSRCAVRCGIPSLHNRRIDVSLHALLAPIVLTPMITPCR
jgi:hypothetical protein